MRGETMADESEQQQQSEGPELEPRKNREPLYGDRLRRAETPEAERRTEDNRAIYLIEREAIRLRRYRWEQSDEARQTARAVDDAAPPRTAAGTAASSAAPRLNELLAMYGRPQPPQPAETREKLLPRLWQWVEWLRRKK
jgi:hypothetical protein